MCASELSRWPDFPHDLIHLRRANSIASAPKSVLHNILAPGIQSTDSPRPGEGSIGSARRRLSYNGGWTGRLITSHG